MFFQSTFLFLFLFLFFFHRFFSSTELNQFTTFFKINSKKSTFLSYIVCKRIVLNLKHIPPITSNQIIALLLFKIHVVDYRRVYRLNV